MAATATHATQLREGDVIDGMVPFTQPIHIELALKLRNKAALDSFIQSASVPTRPSASWLPPFRRTAFADRGTERRPSSTS